MSNKKEILVSDLRDKLKSIMQKEIENLPKQLEAMESKERLNYVIKLMPFVFPKVNTIHSASGEPFNLDY